MAPPTRRLIIATALFAFLSAILAGTFFPWYSVFFSVLPCFLFAGILSRSWRAALAVMFCFFALGLARIHFEPRAPMPDDVGIFARERSAADSIKVSGMLSEFPDIRFNQEKWIVSVTQILNADGTEAAATGKVLLSLPRESGLDFGDTITASGKLEIPFESEEFSYRNYLARKHIYAVMAYPTVIKNDQGTPSPMLASLYRLRLWLDQSLQTFIPPPETGLAAGILVGDTRHLPPAISDQFRVAGLSHLLALSGFNITIIVLAMFFLLRWLPKPARLFVTAAAVFIFVVFAGSGASVVRAGVMGVIGLFIVHTGREASGFTLLLLASAIMAMVSPLLLAYDPSFQLSFAGVAGIIGFERSFAGVFQRFAGKTFSEILAVTLSAQLGVLPLILFLFGEVSLVAPLANLLIAPIIPYAMLSAFLTVIFGGLWTPLGHVFGFISWNILHLILTGAELFAKIPGASISARLRLWECVALALFIITTALYAGHRKARA